MPQIYPSSPFSFLLHELFFIAFLLSYIPVYSAPLYFTVSCNFSFALNYIFLSYKLQHTHPLSPLNPAEPYKLFNTHHILYVFYNLYLSSCITEPKYLNSSVAQPAYYHFKHLQA